MATCLGHYALRKFREAHTAFQGDDVFRKNKGLVIESGIIGAAALTTKDMKGTRQSRKTTLLVTCFVFFVSFVVKAALRRSGASSGLKASTH